MHSEDPSSSMALEWETVNRILILVSILGFAVAILGAVGEYLGWWNAVGEVLMTSGTVVGALTGLASLVGGASQRTVDAVQATVEQNQDLLRESNEQLGTLDDIEAALDQQTTVLREIRDQG